MLAIIGFVIYICIMKVYTLIVGVEYFFSSLLFSFPLFLLCPSIFLYIGIIIFPEYIVLCICC